MSAETGTVDGELLERVFAPGTILISRAGQVKILRSRNRDDDGWNCADGAGVSDEELERDRQWTPYTPEELAADLQMAAEINQMRGHRVFSGGLATWDACSGRPCVLPRLARLAN